MLTLVTMLGRCLPAKHEKVLAAVARLLLVGNPIFHQVGPLELAEPEIQHQWFDPGRSQFLPAALRPETRHGARRTRPLEADIKSLL